MKALVPVFLVVFVLSPAFCATHLLSLERSEAPAGPWQRVPANTLPVTDDGAFLEDFDGPSGFYRMRIEDVSGAFPELNIPLDQVPVEAREYAQSLLDSMRNLDGDNEWEGAELGPLVFPIYDPCVSSDEPAYLEFKVLYPDPSPPPGESSPPPTHRETNLGFILVSLTRDEAPILDHATEGITRTERLRRLARSSAVKVFRYGASLLAAEDPAGKLAAYIGVPPVYYPDEILEYCGLEFEGYEHPEGGQHPEPLPFQGEPYASYEEFKVDWVLSRRFEHAREIRRQEVGILWDIYTGDLERKATLLAVRQEAHLFPDEEVSSFVLGDPDLAFVTIGEQGVLVSGRSPGTTTYRAILADDRVVEGYLGVAEEFGDPVFPECWTPWADSYAGNWSQQRRYTQEWGGSCYSGCGPTAWAMLYGWFDVTGRATNLIGPTATPAPLYNNSSVRDCIWYIVPRVGVTCVGDQGVTNPWNMYKGYSWAQHRGHGYAFNYAWTVPCFSSGGARNRARDSIRNDGRPSIIAMGCTSPHYALAYGYKEREWKAGSVVWYVERFFKCNMGWGGSTPQWVSAEVWYGQRNNFW